MPEYTLASIVALGLAAIAALVAGLHRRRATWLTLAVFGAFTVVFDIVLTGLPIVTYGEEATAGIAIGPMPVEDLLYGWALCLAALVAWAIAGRRGATR